MTITEADVATATAVLAAARVVDRRMPEADRDVVRAWAELLAGIDPQLAFAAVRRHYETSSDRLMPADVRRIAAQSDPPYQQPLAALPHAPAFDLDKARAWLDQCRTVLRDAPREPQPAYIPRRARGRVGVRAPEETSRRLARAQREAHRPVVDGKTDAERARIGKPITVCHGCVGDIPAPDGWHPHGKDPVYCRSCQQLLDEAAVDPTDRHRARTVLRGHIVPFPDVRFSRR